MSTRPSKRSPAGALLAYAGAVCAGAFAGCLYLFLQTCGVLP